MKKVFSIVLAVLIVLSGICVDFSAASGFTFEQNVAYGAVSKAPSLKCTVIGKEGIQLSWDRLPNAKEYEVFRSTSKSGEYQKIGTVSKPIYTDNKIKQNKTYYYKVRVANTSTGKYSNIVSKKITTQISAKDVPKYSGKAYIEINKNKPAFSKAVITDKSFESYSKLDKQGRCGIAFACVGLDTMPTKERGSIGMVKPVGWHTVRYDDLISDKYLYNRCHLIGYQLTAENANERNLITGTRYLNITGMLPFENMVADYVKSTGNHVMYRVTPIYSGSDLLCLGVQMEGYSVEDKGKGICFNVFAYNVQPGIDIDYETGESCISGKKIEKKDEEKTNKSGSNVYILNKNSKKFHYPNCSSVKDMKEKNKLKSSQSREAIIKSGYEPCKRCNP